jgi:hypothetical protein
LTFDEIGGPGVYRQVSDTVNGTDVLGPATTVTVAVAITGYAVPGITAATRVVKVKAVEPIAHVHLAA